MVWLPSTIPLDALNRFLSWAAVPKIWVRLSFCLFARILNTFRWDNCCHNCATAYLRYVYQCRAKKMKGKNKVGVLICCNCKTEDRPPGDVFKLYCSNDADWLDSVLHACLVRPPFEPVWQFALWSGDKRIKMGKGERKVLKSSWRARGKRINYYLSTAVSLAVVPRLRRVASWSTGSMTLQLSMEEISRTNITTYVRINLSLRIETIIFLVNQPAFRAKSAQWQRWKIDWPTYTFSFRTALKIKN